MGRHLKKTDKTGAAAVQERALGKGHNSLTKEAELKYLKRDMDIVEKIAKLNDDRKANLRDAKDAGMSKMGIRSATKEMRMTLEQRQAIQEVEDQKKHYIAACREEGLFVPEEMEEEAA